MADDYGVCRQQARLTINDRASGMLKMSKVSSKQAQTVGQATVEELRNWAPYIKTITADNGKEFTVHKYVAEKINVDYYFARPYHSWERGSYESPACMMDKLLFLQEVVFIT